jgi:4'-phosphopantetheinyl transferase
VSRLVVAYAPDLGAGTAGTLLAREVAWFCGIDPEQVALARSCPRCASTAHGRPHVIAPARPGGRPAPQVSLARSHHGRDRAGTRTDPDGDAGPGADPIVVVALTDAGPVGVDVEAAGASAFPGFAAVALHPRERADDEQARTRAWVRKEALLKATGDGLRVDPRTIQLSDPGEPPRVVHWPGLTGPAWLSDLDLPPAWVGALAVLCRTPPTVLVHPAPDHGVGPGQPPGSGTGSGSRPGAA